MLAWILKSDENLYSRGTGVNFLTLLPGQKGRNAVDLGQIPYFLSIELGHRICIEEQLFYPGAVELGVCSTPESIERATAGLPELKSEM